MLAVAIILVGLVILAAYDSTESRSP